MNSYGYRCLKPTEISTALYIKSPGWVSKLTVATPLQVWSKHEELPRHCGPQSGHEEVWTWKKIDPNGTALWLGKDKTWQCRKKSQNESGCFYLFLSVPLSFWLFTTNIDPAILLYILQFTSKSSIVVPVPQPAPLGLISADPDPQKIRLFGLFRDEEVKGGIRILTTTWRIRSDHRSGPRGSEALAVIPFGREVLLNKNQTDVRRVRRLMTKHLRWKPTIFKHKLWCLDG